MAHMQEREDLATLNAVDARFAGMSRWVSPAERKVLTAVWTAPSEMLLQYVLSAEPPLAVAAIGELAKREKSPKFPLTPKRVNDTLAQCLTPKTDPQLRTSAALALAAHHDPRSLPVLRTLLTPKDKQTLHEGATPLRAAFLLARFQDTVSYAAIRRLSSQLDDPTKRHFADLLCLMGDATSVSLLRELLKNPYQGTRSHAALGLGRLRGRSSVPALIHALSDGYAEVRRDAAWALAAIGDTKALAALRKATTTKNSAFVPAHDFRGAQEMARQAVVALEKGEPLEITRDGRGNPLSTGRF